MSNELELIYVADTMCSWCWGFAPVLDELAARYGLPVRVVNGGLRPGDQAEELDDKTAAWIGEHWEHVRDASGQPFDFAGLTRRDGWRYDTEPAAMSVVAMRELHPELTLAWFHRLQRAFYAENIDITDPASWPALLEGFDVDVEVLMAAATADSARAAAVRDYLQARKWGISGFPTLLVRDGEQLSLVTKGWAPKEAVVDGIGQWLQSKGVAVAAPAVAEGDACGLDGTC